MDVTVTEAKNRLTQLLRSVENGELVVITRNGKPIAQIGPTPKRGKVRFGGLRDRVKLYPGWDDPIDEDEFLAGEAWPAQLEPILRDTNIVNLHKGSI